MVKSIAVVVGSYLLSILLVMASDPLLSLLFPENFIHGQIPTNAPLVMSTVLFVCISILCAWLCAHFAPANQSRHILWFFILGEILGIASVVPNWGKGWPHWYWLSWLISWPFSCWLGLALAKRKAHLGSSPA